MQAPSDAARPNHARVVLEKSGEVLCIPQRALRRDTLPKPFREAEKRKRSSQKSRPKRRLARRSLLKNRGLSRGIRVRVGRDGDPLFRKKGRVLDVLLSADGKRRATLALDGGGRVDEPGYKERAPRPRSRKTAGPCAAF